MLTHIHLLTILFSIFIIFNFHTDTNDYPEVYQPESKLILTERHADYAKCVSLCDSGVYHHHHLKQTHIGKCTS